MEEGTRNKKRDFDFFKNLNELYSSAFDNLMPFMTPRKSPFMSMSHYFSGSKDYVDGNQERSFIFKGDSGSRMDFEPEVNIITFLYLILLHLLTFSLESKI